MTRWHPCHLLARGAQAAFWRQHRPLSARWRGPQGAGGAPRTSSEEVEMAGGVRDRTASEEKGAILPILPAPCRFSCQKTSDPGEQVPHHFDEEHLWVIFLSSRISSRARGHAQRGWYCNPRSPVPYWSRSWACHAHCILEVEARRCLDVLPLVPTQALWSRSVDSQRA